MSQIVNKYNILIAEDLNIYLSRPKSQNDNHFSELKDKFKLTNLIKNPTFKVSRREIVRCFS